MKIFFLYNFWIDLSKYGKFIYITTPVNTYRLTKKKLFKKQHNNFIRINFEDSVFEYLSPHLMLEYEENCEVEVRDMDAFNEIIKGSLENNKLLDSSLSWYFEPDWRFLIGHSDENLLRNFIQDRDLTVSPLMNPSYKQFTRHRMSF